MTARPPDKKNQGVGHKIIRRLGVTLFFLFAAFQAFPIQGADFKVCENCHNEILMETFREYLHLPFLQKRCEECHEAQKPTDKPKKNALAPKIKRGRIDWVGDSVMADVEHGFVLPGDEVGNRVVIEMQGIGGVFFRRAIEVPFLLDLPEVVGGGDLPQISNLDVLRVERGVFLSATVGWETDTLADAQVLYGGEDLSQTSEPVKRFGRWHEVVLNDLKPDKTYLFSAVSTDPFGRKQVSEPGTFSTFRPTAVLREKQLVPPTKSNGKPELKASFFRIDSDYLLDLKMEEPFRVFVGTQNVLPVKKPADVMNLDDKHHRDLRSKEAVSLKVCRDCHKNQATATHPVNVYPKPGMIIPPEYPTLQDGRITCRSCHESHSSNNEYLTIKRGRRELCIGCHKDMI